jgi:hypothetical protein
MVNLDFPWDIKLNERLNKHRWVCRENIKIPNIVKIAAASVWVLLWTTNPAYSQDTAWKDCFVEISEWNNQVSECDFTNPVVSGEVVQEPFISRPGFRAQFYADSIQDVYLEEGWASLPENFDEISVTFIVPLHQVLIDVGLWDIFTGDDAANITALAMQIWQEWFRQQYDYVASSFPRADVNDLFQAKLAKLFSPFSEI